MSKPNAVVIPDKTYFKIGEVAKLLDLEPYVLRYWESEFDTLAPDKTQSGQRIYQREDIELIMHIRGLLYDEMFTIAGARRQLELDEQSPEEQAQGADGEAEPSAQIGLWEERMASQSQEIEELKAELSQAREAAAGSGALQAELAAARQGHQDAQRQAELLQEQADRRLETIEELRAQLNQARRSISALEARPAAPSPGSIDPTLLQDLRRQVESLAYLAQKPN